MKTIEYAISAYTKYIYICIYIYELPISVYKETVQSLH